MKDFKISSSDEESLDSTEKIQKSKRSRTRGRRQVISSDISSNSDDDFDMTTQDKIQKSKRSRKRGRRQVISSDISSNSDDDFDMTTQDKYFFQIQRNKRSRKRRKRSKKQVIIPVIVISSSDADSDSDDSSVNKKNKEKFQRITKLSSSSSEEENSTRFSDNPDQTPLDKLQTTTNYNHPKPRQLIYGNSEDDMDDEDEIQVNNSKDDTDEEDKIQVGQNDVEQDENHDPKTHRRKKKYPDNLTAHLTPMSFQKKKVLEIYKEWKYSSLDDLGDCSGTCPCGKRGIRYKNFIKNTKTGKETHVGSECIKLFDQNMQIISQMAHALKTNGLKNVSCEKIQSNRIQFAFQRGSTIFEKHIQDLRKYFEKIPIRIPPKEKPYLWVSIANPDDANMFTEGRQYNICLQMEVRNDNVLNLVIYSRAILPIKRDSSLVKTFFRQ